GAEDRGLVGDRVVERKQAAIGGRHANELGLPAVEPRVDAGVAEQRPPLTLRDPTRTTVGAGAVRDHARAHDALAGLHVADVGARLDDGACELVAQDRAVLEARREAVEREQVGAADRRQRDLHDRVAGVEDRRVRHRVDTDVARGAEDDGPHAGCSISTRYPSGSTQKKRQPPQGGLNGSASIATSSAWSTACTASASGTTITSTTAACAGSAGAF